MDSKAFFSIPIRMNVLETLPDIQVRMYEIVNISK